MSELFINIFERKIVNMKDFREAFAQLRDGKYLITIKDMRKRSLPQNAYYWAVVVPMVRKGLYEQGFDDVRTNDDAHEIMKGQFLKKTFVNNVTGEMITIDGSSAKISITQFNEYLEAVCKWASEYLQIEIPSPNEAYVLYNDWEQKIIHESDK